MVTCLDFQGTIYYKLIIACCTSQFYSLENGVERGGRNVRLQAASSGGVLTRSVLVQGFPLVNRDSYLLPPGSSLISPYVFKVLGLYCMHTSPLLQHILFGPSNLRSLLHVFLLFSTAGLLVHGKLNL